ncbi:unnamed protein product, partial [Brugia timori]
MQTSRLNMANPLPVTSSNSVPTFSCSSAVQTIPSNVVTADIQRANSLNNSIVCTQNDGTSAQHDRSGVCFNSPVLNLGVTLATQQKCAPISSEASVSTCISSPPPKDPEPAPLKITVSIKKNNDEIAKTSNISKTQLDQIKMSNSKQMRTGNEQQFQDLADNDESRWDDYCYVCQQGCDEKTGSLGCCARCPRVFHNICHIPAIKEQMENLPDEWACSLCIEAEPLHENSVTIGQRERLLCSKVLLSCYEKHLDVEPFCQPVPRTVISYHVIIKQPMDFSTIARRLREKAKDAFTN